MPGLSSDEQFSFAAALFPDQVFYQNVVAEERLRRMQDVATSYGGSIAVYGFGKQNDVVVAGQRLIDQPPTPIGEQQIEEGFAGVQIYADPDVNMWEFLLRADSATQDGSPDTAMSQGPIPPSQT